MARTRSQTLVMIAAATVLAASLITIASGAEQAFAGVTPRCQETQLDVALTSDGAAAGHVGYLIVISNVSSSTCAISGYPTVTMSGDPDVVTSIAKKTVNGYLGGLGSVGAKAPLPKVTLRAHGGKASSLVEGVDVPVGSAVACVTFKKVSIALPLLSPPYRFARAFPGCSRAQVHPFVKGSRGTSSR